jgi:hypothetical protein
LNNLLFLDICASVLFQSQHFHPLSCIYIGDVFKVIMPVRATCDSDYWTCLGHLVQHDVTRNDPICFTQPRQVRKVILHCSIMGVITYKHHQCTWAFKDHLYVQFCCTIWKSILICAEIVLLKKVCIVFLKISFPFHPMQKYFLWQIKQMYSGQYFPWTRCNRI